ncbi:vitamin K epoxide reductase family protein [Sanguibacter suaedae]|uniref:Vitamin K epoxide reductase family protein n=1 Tax=Sanguibacter suaedae TaxID=2795737 RepID=A0A934I8L9_9MICO|nr:vitamin K epoxide reductase family protein [Sanguibacter suaedae]MBI9115142.1 vitamin K epoxide reductase family protein [Sanguibacter suaedae]
MAQDRTRGGAPDDPHGDRPAEAGPAERGPDDLDDDLDAEIEALLTVDPWAGFRHSTRWIFGTMLFSATLSLIAAFVLSYDAVKLAADPSTALSCNISAVVNCGSVALSWQASLFGFPNAFLGLITEPVVITIAVASLAGVRFPRWFMFTAQVIYLLGLVFALWLFSQSMWVIGALCPWCLLITVSTSLVFLTLLHYNVREDNLYLPRGAQERLAGWVRKDYDLYAGILWVAGLLALIVVKYGDRLLG